MSVFSVTLLASSVAASLRRATLVGVSDHSHIRRQATGDRRQATSDKRQATGGRRQATSDRRQATGDRRQATGDRRQATTAARALLALARGTTPALCCRVGVHQAASCGLRRLSPPRPPRPPTPSARRRGHVVTGPPQNRPPSPAISGRQVDSVRCGPFGQSVLVSIRVGVCRPAGISARSLSVHRPSDSRRQPRRRVFLTIIAKSSRDGTTSV